MDMRAIDVVASLLFVSILLCSASVDRPASATQGGSAAGDTLTVEDVRNMIVGTWTEDVSEEVGAFEKGSHEWVFTEDGTLRKYRDGALSETVEYEITQECEDDRMGHLEAASTQLAMLKETYSDGSVLCKYVTNMKKSGEGLPEPPFLLIGTQGGNIYFGKYSPDQ